jgi:Flp pilus assembly protein TadG
MRIHSSRVRDPSRRSGGGFAARLIKEERGATLIEFAFIATPLAALLVAIFQTSLLFFAQQTLETTAEKSVRQIVTGQAQKASMSKSGFKDLVCSKLPAFMKCANVLVDVKSAQSFSDISTSALQITLKSDGTVDDKFGFAPGGPGSINIVRIMYVWDVQSGPLGFDLSTMSNKKRLLYATSVFKTEPYVS